MAVAAEAVRERDVDERFASAHARERCLQPQPQAVGGHRLAEYAAEGTTEVKRRHLRLARERTQRLRRRRRRGNRRANLLDGIELSTAWPRLTLRRHRRQHPVEEPQRLFFNRQPGVAARVQPIEEAPLARVEGR